MIGIDSSDYRQQLLNLKVRYLRLLFVWCDALFGTRELEDIRGILVIQSDLSREVLADIFMVEPQVVQESWTNRGFGVQMCGSLSVMVRSLESLMGLNVDSMDNKSLLKKVEQHHLAISKKLVSRAFSGRAVVRHG